MKFKIEFRIYSLGLIILLVQLLSGCSEKKTVDPNEALEKAVVLDQGMIVKFSDKAPGRKLIKTIEVHKGSATVPVFAPARVVASISKAIESNDKIILFDSPDVTTLYSQYRQNRSNVALTTKNLARIKEMFENHAVTAKDVLQAETDLQNARTSMAELEGRLRAAGFNPVELENSTSNELWLIADVPETQLHEVQNNEEVDIVFNSYPDIKYTGRARAIGDVIDPVTRTVKVRTVMHNTKERLMPGMFARVDFGDPTTNIVVLPLDAIVTVDSKDYAFVEVRPGEFQRRQIVIEKSTLSEVIVLKGIESGEKVVVAGAMLLKGLSFGY